MKIRNFSISQLLSWTTLIAIASFLFRRIAEEASWDWHVFANGLRVGFYPVLLLFNIHRDLSYTCDYSMFCGLGFIIGLLGTFIVSVLAFLSIRGLVADVLGE